MVRNGTVVSDEELNEGTCGGSVGAVFLAIEILIPDSVGDVGDLFL